MPFAPKIRKDILAALDDYIIPALRRDVVTQLIAEPPFDFGDVEHRVLQKAFLVDKEFAPFQTILDWKRQRLIAVRFLRFMVVFEGVCIERVGITRAMARQLKMAGRRATGGIIELTLRAPAVLCHPAFTLNSSGAPQPRPFAQLGRAIYCNIIFKQAQGTTVMNFVTQMRIEAAKTIIADATEPFGDVAQLVGFQNYVSFSNAFARATGMSPRRYRQQHQNGEK